MSLNEAIEQVKKGGFVLVHDSSKRENETDMVFAAEHAEHPHIAKMRQDAGGLICVSIHPDVAEKIEIPYLADIYKSAIYDFEILNSAEADDIPYDERSAFSISVNHRDTFTGITDRDRALTIRELGKMSEKVLNGNSSKEFGKKFRTPGHVPLLRASEGLLEKREGHTELSIALMEMAQESPSAVVCEMLDAETGKALSTEKAIKYSEDNEIPFLEGEEIVKSYLEWKDNEDV
jgi:3,4-dihydroxy 2-butanone 4-phosphate synthase